MFLKRVLVLLCLSLSLVSFSQSKNLNILFVGNSLTYTNNLPKLVKKEAKQKGVSIKTQMLTLPNYALEDHCNDGKLQSLINSEDFSYIIIQQGPSSQAYGRESLIDYGKKISTLFKGKDTKLMYYMVWPSMSYYRTFDAVIKNYTNAAKLNNALLAPVGQVWKTHFEDTGDFSYYGSDGFHPSVKGSKVAAQVIVETLLTDLNN